MRGTAAVFVAYLVVIGLGLVAMIAAGVLHR